MKRGHPKQMSESFLTAAFLSLSGGLQDAYTYIYRGHVFANAQTGNIVLLSQSIAERNWTQTLEYLIPLSFFAFGIAAAELLRFRYQNTTRIHWRQLVLLFEIAILFAVGFMPETCAPTASFPLPVRCRYRPSARSKAIPLPAPCVSAICAAEWNPCVPTGKHRIEQIFKNPFVTGASS